MSPKHILFILRNEYGCGGCQQQHLERFVCVNRKVIYASNFSKINQQIFQNLNMVHMTGFVRSINFHRAWECQSCQSSLEKKRKKTLKLTLKCKFMQMSSFIRKLDGKRTKFSFDVVNDARVRPLDRSHAALWWSVCDGFRRTSNVVYHIYNHNLKSAYKNSATHRIKIHPWNYQYIHS